MATEANVELANVKFVVEPIDEPNDSLTQFLKKRSINRKKRIYEPRHLIDFLPGPKRHHRRCHEFYISKSGEYHPRRPAHR